MQWISPETWNRFTAHGTNTHRIATHKHGWIDRYDDSIVETSNASSLIDALSPELVARFNFSPHAWFLRQWSRDARDQQPARLIHGTSPGSIVVRESNINYQVILDEGYSTGLFLDQRLNRLWASSLAPRSTLNLFAYTCSFSICTALAGSKTLNIDTSKHSLQRGKTNFRLNNIPTDTGHRFIAEDVLQFVPRLARRGEAFNLIILDPPTFGRANGRVFRIERDLPGLIHSCAKLLAPNGSLLVSCNNARWSSQHLRALCSESLPPEKPFHITPGESPSEILNSAISFRIKSSA